MNDLPRPRLGPARVDEVYVSPLISSGVCPGVDLDKALDLAGRLDDEELVRTFEVGK